MFFKKYSLGKIDYYLILLISTLSIASLKSLSEDSIWFMQREWIYESHGNFSLIEFIQLTLLILNIFLILKNRQVLIKSANNLLIFAIRIFIPIFIIFEETSFFFKDYFKGSFLTEINIQSEANFHNIEFMHAKLFSNNQLGAYFLINDITLANILYSLIFIILSFGAFMPFLKRFNFVFFEKRFVVYGLLYIFNILISYFIKKVFGIMNSPSSYYFLSDEFLELFYYQLLLLDLRQKIFKSRI